jgi:hypothetical protein
MKNQVSECGGSASIILKVTLSDLFLDNDLPYSVSQGPWQQLEVRGPSKSLGLG